MFSFGLKFCLFLDKDCEPVKVITNRKLIQTYFHKMEINSSDQTLMQNARTTNKKFMQFLESFGIKSNIP